MKQIIITILFILVIASPTYAIDTDKKKHFAVSVPCGIIGAAIIEKCCPDWPWYYKTPASVAIGMIPGFGKEAIDQITYGGWDNKDLVADGLGSLTGAGIYLAWEW